MSHQPRLRDALNRIREQRGVTVTYARGSATVTLAATVGKTGQNQDIAPEGGVVIRTGVRDYIISAASLILSGSLTAPQRGDKITEGSSIYEVMPLGEDCFRYCDSGRTQLRIHTHQIEGL